MIQAALHNCGMQPTFVTQTPQMPTRAPPQPIITAKPPVSSIQNPFLPFLKPVYLPEPNRFEPQLYNNEAREFPN